ncbi:MAG TPA: helix-turn-helix transcriptional regulator [Gammaproteobacteria bacterium]
MLDCHRDPLLVIDEEPTLLYKNRAAQAIGGRDGLAECGRKLRLGPKADAELRRIVAAYRRANVSGGGCRGLRLAQRDREWLLLVCPLERPPGVQSIAHRFLLHAVARTAPRTPPHEALHDVFGLTPREISVATELFRSATVRLAAQRLKLAPETVRSHLKRTFRKCNVHSQAELFALFQSLSEFGPPR